MITKRTICKDMLERSFEEADRLEVVVDEKEELKVIRTLMVEDGRMKSAYMTILELLQPHLQYKKTVDDSSMILYSYHINEKTHDIIVNLCNWNKKGMPAEVTYYKGNKIIFSIQNKKDGFKKALANDSIEKVYK